MVAEYTRVVTAAMSVDQTDLTGMIDGGRDRRAGEMYAIGTEVVRTILDVFENLRRSTWRGGFRVSGKHRHKHDLARPKIFLEILGGLNVVANFSPVSTIGAVMACLSNDRSGKAMRYWPIPRRTMRAASRFHLAAIGQTGAVEQSVEDAANIGNAKEPYEKRH